MKLFYKTMFRLSCPPSSPQLSSSPVLLSLVGPFVSSTVFPLTLPPSIAFKKATRPLQLPVLHLHHHKFVCLQPVKGPPVTWGGVYCEYSSVDGPGIETFELGNHFW